MGRASPLRGFGLIAALIAAGCHSVTPAHLPPEAAVLTPAALPVIAPPEAAPSPGRTPPSEADAGAGPRPPMPPAARALEPEMALCLAVRNAEVARALDEKGRGLMADDPGRRHPLHPGRDAEAWHARAVLAEALALEAADVRNEAGGSALQAFYRLAQVQAQTQVVRHSLGVVERARSATSELLRRGQDVMGELQSLDRQQIELRDRGEEADRGIQRLGEQLDSLMTPGAAAPSEPIWPLMTWEIGPPPDPDAAAGVALANRPQLILLRRLIAELDGALRPMARSILGAVDPLLSADPRPASLGAVLSMVCGLPDAREEADVASLRSQLRSLLAWRERAVAQEAREAALDAQSAARRAALARERYLGRLSDVDRLRAKASRGLTSALEIHRAELELDGAQSTWVEQVAQWHLSMARMEQAQGLLPARCGLAPAPGGGPASLPPRPAAVAAGSPTPPRR